MSNPSIFVGIPNLKHGDKFADMIPNAIKYVRDQDCKVEIREPYISPDYSGASVDFGEGKKTRLIAITDRINACIDAFCKSDATHLWLIDADIEVPRHALRTLLNLNADIASGIYCFHNDPVIMMFGRIPPDQKRMFAPRGFTSWQGAVLGENEYVSGGNGCMLMRKRVFDIYDPNIKSLRFVSSENGGGSDIYFWYRAQQAGFKCRVTGDVLCGHLPQYPLSYYESDDFKQGLELFYKLKEEALGKHKLVYRGIDSLWHLADANTTTTMLVYGMTLGAISSGRKGKILLMGYIGNSTWTWTVGGELGIIYASGTPGEMTQTAPALPTDRVQAVAVALTTTSIWFAPPGVIATDGGIGVVSNHGSATVANGGTIAHGLGGTPTAVCLTANGTIPIEFGYTADATNITVYHTSGGSPTVVWRAEL